MGCLTLWTCKSFTWIMDPGGFTYWYCPRILSKRWCPRILSKRWCPRILSKRSWPKILSKWLCPRILSKRSRPRILTKRSWPRQGSGKSVRLVRFFLDKSKSCGQFCSETTRQWTFFRLSYHGHLSYCGHLSIMWTSVHSMDTCPW